MSTPIETNTEQLQEVLQQVYNLPSRSGGNTPDLVLGFNTENTKHYLNSYQITAEDFTIKSGSALSTYTKMKNREEVKVILEVDTFYGSSVFTSTFYPFQVGAEDEGDPAVNYVVLDFITTYVPGLGTETEKLSMRIGVDGTIADITMYQV